MVRGLTDVPVRGGPVDKAPRIALEHLGRLASRAIVHGVGRDALHGLGPDEGLFVAVHEEHEVARVVLVGRRGRAAVAAPERDRDRLPRQEGRRSRQRARRGTFGLGKRGPTRGSGRCSRQAATHVRRSDRRSVRNTRAVTDRPVQADRGRRRCTAEPGQDRTRGEGRVRCRRAGLPRSAARTSRPPWAPGRQVAWATGTARVPNSGRRTQARTDERCPVARPATACRCLSCHSREYQHFIGNAPQRPEWCILVRHESGRTAAFVCTEEPRHDNSDHVASGDEPGAIPVNMPELSDGISRRGTVRRGEPSRQRSDARPWHHARLARSGTTPQRSLAASRTRRSSHC